MDWSPEQIATLTRLWEERHTASFIGERMGITKSAVVGKAHRLHLPGRPNPCRPQGRAKPPKQPSGPKIAKSRKVKPTETKENNPSYQQQTARDQRRAYFTTIGTNGHTCTAMIGEPKTPEFKPCTEPALIKRAFCLEHCVQYLLPVRPLLRRSPAAKPASPQHVQDPDR